MTVACRQWPFARSPCTHLYGCASMCRGQDMLAQHALRTEEQGGEGRSWVQVDMRDNRGCGESHAAHALSALFCECAQGSSGSNAAVPGYCFPDEPASRIERRTHHRQLFCCGDAKHSMLRMLRGVVYDTRGCDQGQCQGEGLLDAGDR